MSADEAPELLRHAGVDVDSSDVAELVERIEGWPAGLYPAARDSGAALARPTGHRVPASGNDRFMSDYLRAELLDHVSPGEVEFLTRTSCSTP